MAQPTVDYIWMNGELVEWDKAQVHVLTHGLHYGSGVFEGIRCYKTPQGPAVFRLYEHMKRLKESAAMMYMDLDYTVEELCEATLETIRANKIEECYIRPLVFRGYGSMGVDPLAAPTEIIIAIWPWGAYLGEDALEKGVKVGVSSWRQRAVNAMPPQIKAAGNYINSSFARMEANRHGYAEAILLNEAGKVAEGTGENLFIVKDGVVITPPVSDGILAGITRDSVITILREMGIEVREQSIVRTELYTADEFFMTGTAAELVPVSSCDNIQIGKGGMGDLTRKIQALFFETVTGQNNNHPEWLAHI